MEDVVSTETEPLDVAIIMEGAMGVQHLMSLVAVPSSDAVPATELVVRV